MIRIDQQLIEEFVDVFSQKINHHKYLHQYTSINSINKTLDDMYNIVQYLKMIDSTSILNIGTGPGIFEYIAKLNNLYVKTVEYTNEPDKELNQFIRDFFGTNIDYESTDFRNYKINTEDKFGIALISRFGPFQVPASEELIDAFLTEVLNHAEEIIIPNLLLSSSVSDYLNNKAHFDGFAYTIKLNDFIV